MFFLDSDDCLFPDTLSILVEDAIKFSADLVIGSFTSITDDSKTKTNTNTNIMNEKHIITSNSIVTMNREQAMMLFFKNKDINISQYSVWGKLWKKQLFTQIRFPVGKIHEDVFIAHRLWFSSKIIVLDKREVYMYRKSEQSITRKHFDSKRLDIIEALFEQLAFFEKKENAMYINYVWNNILYAFYDSYVRGMDADCFRNTQFLLRYTDFFQVFKEKWRKNRYPVTRKTKIKIRMFLTRPKIFYLIFSIHIKLALFARKYLF